MYVQVTAYRKALTFMIKNLDDVNYPQLCVTIGL